jgi:hypothetical protein
MSGSAVSRVTNLTIPTTPWPLSRRRRQIAPSISTNFFQTYRSRRSLARWPGCITNGIRTCVILFIAISAYSSQAERDGSAPCRRGETSRPTQRRPAQLLQGREVVPAAHRGNVVRWEQSIMSVHGEIYASWNAPAQALPDRIACPGKLEGSSSASPD